MKRSSKNAIPASSKPYDWKPTDLAPGEIDRLEAAVPKFEKATPQELDRVARELRRARAEDALRKQPPASPKPQ